MKEYENMFKYKFKKNVSNILEQLKKMEIFYIEISPIVPENSNIYFYEKKIFNQGELSCSCNRDDIIRNGMRKT